MLLDKGAWIEPASDGWPGYLGHVGLFLNVAVGYRGLLDARLRMYVRCAFKTLFLESGRTLEKRRNPKLLPRLGLFTSSSAIANS